MLNPKSAILAVHAESTRMFALHSYEDITLFAYHQIITYDLISWCTRGGSA